jgi:hypothetical protein
MVRDSKLYLFMYEVPKRKFVTGNVDERIKTGVAVSSFASEFIHIKTQRRERKRSAQFKTQHEQAGTVCDPFYQLICPSSPHRKPAPLFTPRGFHTLSRLSHVLSFYIYIYLSLPVSLHLSHLAFLLALRFGRRGWAPETSTRMPTRAAFGRMRSAAKTATSASLPKTP